MLPMHEVLEISAQKYPNKTAVICEKEKISYKKLNKDSSILSDFLVSQGIKEGDRIGIFTTKCIEEIIAIFAILKAGGIFVHINPQYKKMQLSHIISDCNIKVLFTSKNKERLIDGIHRENNIISLIISLSPTINLSNNICIKTFYLKNILCESSKKAISYKTANTDKPAAIIYTSGSTGPPKGIIVTNKIFYDSTSASVKVLENNINDRLISITPFSFDGALSQLFSSIYVRGTLVLQKSLFPKDIVKTLMEKEITGFHAVPSLFGILLQKHSPLAKYEYHHLRYISTIGEIFPQKYLLRLKKILGNTKIYNMYGTTEAFRSTYLPPEDLEKKPLSIGKPFPDVSISIVDNKNDICQTDEIGEIVHKGAFISPGYWNNDKETKKRFCNNSLYTGDLGKIDKDGYLYFTGRKDSMIKTSGYRVSPEEIENCIYQLKGIKEVAVIGDSNTLNKENFSNTIKAVIVCEASAEINSQNIIKHCRKHLPHYMVPMLIELRSSLPKTSTNKINKAKLY